jgi:Uncharacterized protein conserved in bacteria (DUF2188)
VHTVKRGDRWANVYEGSDRILERAPTKTEAVRAGGAGARKNRVEHVIHRADDAITERNSYARDPALTTRDLGESSAEDR